MKLHFAPLQGHTTAPYRYYHSKNYQPAEAYYTPFIRYENSEVKKRDKREVTSDLNEGLNVIPQVIFRDENELSSLVGYLKEEGFNKIDLNMGCPFPLQTGKGRGAAMIASPEAPEILRRIVEENPEVAFSLKMRLGMSEPDEWKSLMPVVNSLPFQQVVLHPRVARQQYGGEPDMEKFAEFLGECERPVIYNGDLLTPEDVDNVCQRFPDLAGIMIGRGLLARPSLTDEMNSGEEWSREKRIEKLLLFHRQLLSYFGSVLCGDSQILDNIKSFWEYSENEIGRKAWKNIRKASNMAKYVSAVAMID